MAVTPVGAPGKISGTTLFDGPEATPVPFAFVAVTVNVYVVLFVSPVIVIGLDGPDAVMFPVLEVTV